MSAVAKLLVVHWNQPDACAATVDAMIAQGVPLAVTVLDNSSEPAAFEQLRAKLGATCEIVRLKKNRGWGGALNVALKRWLAEETTTFCLISAHDAAPAPECLARLIAAAEGDAELAIVCPQFPEPYVTKLSRRRGVFPDKVEPQPTGSVEEVDAPHGTLMLVRRECLQEIGLFDERYFAYGDEHELGVRARRHGWKVAMVWGAMVTNPNTSTASALRSYLFARNSLLLVHDYFGARASWARVVLLLGNTLRLALTREAGANPSARLRGVRDFALGRFGPP
jgi:GT2 family glycosyltransferase